MYDVFGEQTHGAVNLSQHAGNRGFTGARITGEYHVQVEFGRGFIKSFLLAQTQEFKVGGKFVDFLFYRCKSYQCIEFFAGIF